MAGHMLDVFIFSSTRLSQRTKAFMFYLLAGVVVGCFWWFRNVAWGMDGPITDHWGLRWRKVSLGVSRKDDAACLLTAVMFFESRTRT
jgi:dolichyl-phosphate-mannose-protein mannosyltransferase